MFLLLSFSLFIHLMLFAPESSLATTIMVLTPVSCYYMTPFNCVGKKARSVGLTCGCHLSNIMPDSIFYDSMGWGMTQFFLVFLLFFLVGVVIAVFLRIEEMDSVLSL